MVVATSDISVEAVALGERVEAYCDAVLSGEIPSCKWVRLAVQRYRRDVATGQERGLWHDPEAASAVVQFFRFLRHFEGDFAGRPIALEPWQEFRVWNVFGWMRADGTRRFRAAYNEIARKNGKSTEAAGIGLYGLLGDGELGPQCYSGAVNKRQARDVLHSKAEKYVRKSPSLAKALNIAKVTGTISCDANDGKYEPLGKDSDTQEGFNPHFALLDELHAHPDGSVYEVIDSAFGARSQPLMWIVTTAGFDSACFCYEQRKYATAVLEGAIEDDTFFAIIYTIDEDDNWEDEACWYKANPNLRISVDLDDMRRMAEKAKKQPSAKNNFLTKKLNVWTSQAVAWTNIGQWKQSPPAIPEAELIGLPCYSGLDLSTNTDLTALVHLFPLDDDLLAVLPRLWIPADNIRERERRDAALYQTWVEEGLVTATPGNVIDYKRVMADIEADAQRFDIQQLGFDRWNFEPIRQRLIEGDIREERMIAFGQGYASMSAPMKKLEELYLAHKLIGLNHPVLLWMAGNVQAETDPAENIKPVKSKDRKLSRKRIDGIVALIMAIGLWSTKQQPASVYDSRGILSL